MKKCFEDLHYILTLSELGYIYELNFISKNIYDKSYVPGFCIICQILERIIS